MKLIKTANGKRTIKMSKSEWQSIGKKAGWTKEASYEFPQQLLIDIDDISRNVDELEVMGDVAAEEGLSNIRSLNSELEQVAKSISYATNSEWNFPNQVYIDIRDLEENFKDIVVNGEGSVITEDVRINIDSLKSELDSVKKILSWHFKG